MIPKASKAYTDRASGLDEAFRRSYPGAFSGADLYAILKLPSGKPYGLGNLAAIGISTHRDTFPVTTLSRINARGFTQGHRTIAGTLIFHTIDRVALQYRLESLPGQYGKLNGGTELSRGPLLPDELPLFDVCITYANDVGMASYEVLLGVRLLDGGKTVSLENLHPMESYSYMALDYQPLQSVIPGSAVTEAFHLQSPVPPRKQGLRTGEGVGVKAQSDELLDVFGAVINQDNYGIL